MTIGLLWARPRQSTTAPLVMCHMYSVASVARNAYGIITSIVLRNPWGVDGVGNDSNRYDGLVTVTPAQLMQYVGAINYGRRWNH